MRRYLGVAAAALLALCCWAAAASASGGGGEKGALGIGMTLRASHGYRVSIYGFDADPSGVARPAREREPHDGALMLVEGRHASVLYETTHASVTPEAIDAHFGAAGDVDVSWRPGTRTRTERSPCGGRPIRFQEGSWVGSIAFHGEEGFSSVEAGEAPGTLRFVLEILCGSPVGVETGSASLPGAELAATTPEARGSRVEVDALQGRPGRRVAVNASISEKPAPGLIVLRGIQVAVPAGALRVGKSFAAATLAPPAPFSGHGTFRRRGGSWSGDLRADFPGHAGVRLTGPNATAALRHARITHESPQPVG